MLLVMEKIIANRFNIFFVNVGESLAIEIPFTNICPSEYIKYAISEKFYASAVTEDEICKIICNFKDGAAGWDDLWPHIMKLIQNCIKSPFAHICNRSIMTGILPSELNIANVVPTFKSAMTWCFPITGLFLYYLYCQKSVKKSVKNRKVYVQSPHSVHRSPLFMI